MKTSHLETQIQTMRKNRQRALQDRDERIQRLESSARKDKQHSAAMLMQLQTENKGLQKLIRDAPQRPVAESSQSMLVEGLRKQLDLVRRDQETWRKEKGELERRVGELRRELRGGERLQQTVADLRREQQSWKQEKLGLEQHLNTHSHEKEIWRQEKRRLEKSIADQEQAMLNQFDTVARLQNENQRLRDAGKHYEQTRPKDSNAADALSKTQSVKDVPADVPYSRMMHHDWLSGMPTNLFPIDREKKLDEISRRPRRKELSRRPRNADPRQPHAQPVRYRPRQPGSGKSAARRGAAADTEGDAVGWPKRAVAVRIPARGDAEDEDSDDASHRNLEGEPYEEDPEDGAEDAPYEVGSAEDDSEDETSESAEEEDRADGDERPLRNASLQRLLRDELDIPPLIPGIVGDREKLAFYEGKRDREGRRKRNQATFLVGRDNAG